MKALTIYQPWATLIMLGAKPFEFRHWDFTSRLPQLVGQRIVIHAAAREIKLPEVFDIRLRILEGESGLKSEIALPLVERILDAPKGRGIVEMSAGLGTAIIGKPRRVGEIFSGTIDSDRLDHTVFGWPLTSIARFDEPIACKGAQGFWNWPFSVTNVPKLLSGRR
jgi:hypothetical protein